MRVVDEVASGDDVTEQYVDLQSQLTNLEATRARIQEFLQDAKTMDEALRINQELANIEAQIEQIKGRMNYLNDRSAFSTITINFEPEFPVLTPTPTPTAHPTPHPSRGSLGNIRGSEEYGHCGISGDCRLPHLGGCGDRTHLPAAWADPLGNLETDEPEDGEGGE